MNVEVKCKFCKRYLMTARGTTIVEQLPCPNSKCRAKLNIKIVSFTSSDEDIRYKFSVSEVKPKGMKK